MSRRIDITEDMGKISVEPTNGKIDFVGCNIFESVVG